MALDEAEEDGAAEEAQDGANQAEDADTGVIATQEAQTHSKEGRTV